MRIPLYSPLESRDGTLAADANLKNALVEVGEGDGTILVMKRPGIALTNEIITGGLAQGVADLNGELYAVENDELWTRVPMLGAWDEGTISSVSVSDLNTELVNNSPLSLTHYCSVYFQGVFYVWIVWNSPGFINTYSSVDLVTWALEPTALAAVQRGPRIVHNGKLVCLPKTFDASTAFYGDRVTVFDTAAAAGTSLTITNFPFTGGQTLRTEYALASFGGYLWLHGGTDEFVFGQPQELYNDVWKSATGASWELVSSGVGNLELNSTLLAYANKLWLFQDGYDWYNSTDGITWAFYELPGESITVGYLHSAGFVEYAGNLWVFNQDTSGNVITGSGSTLYGVFNGTLWTTSGFGKWAGTQNFHTTCQIADYTYLNWGSTLPYVIGDSVYVISVGVPVKNVSLVDYRQHIIVNKLTYSGGSTPLTSIPL